MIISKTPVRISVGGGGTDLPSFYKRYGSFFVSAAIDKYIYIVVQERKHYDDFVIKYSKTETVKKIGEIENEIVRECLRKVEIATPLEIVSFSDVGGMSGLGSSGAFTVGLLNALYAYKREVKSQEQLAEEACQIAIENLKKPSGKQDEYIAAVGGMSAFEIDKKGKVKIEKERFDRDFVEELDHFLYMFHTGISRQSSEVLKHQDKATKNNDEEMINNLKNVQALGREIDEALKNEEAKKFGELMHKHWQLKRKRAKTSNKQIDEWYDLARKNGAIGGKLMGAGGGGFFLFYCEEGGRDLIRAMESVGLRHVPFAFDWRGTKVVADF